MKRFFSGFMGIMFLMLFAHSAVAGNDSVTAENITSQKEQVPGYYRIKIGNLEVTALYDGYTKLPVKLLHGMKEKNMDTLLSKNFLQTKQGVQTAINAYIVNSGKEIVLIDAGAGKDLGEKSGHLIAAIEAAGYRPEQITHVLLTHLHADHCGGIVTAEGNMAFSGAEVMASKEDADFWLDEKTAAQAPKEAKPFFALAQAAVAPYIKAGKFITFTGGKVGFSWLKSVSSFGHTPGHTSYLVTSKGENMLIWGDIMHSHAIQFTHPEVSIEFDINEKEAIKTRKIILDLVVKNKYWIAGAHLPFPGIGHVVKAKEGYRFVPVEFGPVGENPAN